MVRKPHLLIILDGFGFSKEHKYNAIYQAKPKNLFNWFNSCPRAILQASGSSVGLLPGMMGNSEVGHLTIGSGRIIKQPVSIFHEEIQNGSFFKNKLLIKRFSQLKKSGSTLHIIGLLSDAGVHSYDEDLFALLKIAADVGLEKIFIHPFLDGRDVPPKSAAHYLEQLDGVIKQFKRGKIGSLHGRFYAMDRDKNWQRTEKSYNMLTHIQQNMFDNWQDILDYWYNQNITDEFIPPTALQDHVPIKPEDSVLFFNYREDRARQLTQALVDPNFTGFKTHPLSLSFMITSTLYNPEFLAFKVEPLYIRKIVKNTFFDVLAKAKKHIFTIAETEKKAAVTYFFNGGREITHAHETRILIQSRSYKNTYADIPEMSAPKITDLVITSLVNDLHDFYLINFANADMVGHSGNLEATIKAIQCLDRELKKIYDIAVTELDGTMYITSDHGNAEKIFNKKLNQLLTSHTQNPVPFIIINKELEGKKQNLRMDQLADIAPFILKKLGLQIPAAMKK